MKGWGEEGGGLNKRFYFILFSQKKTKKKKISRLKGTSLSLQKKKSHEEIPNAMYLPYLLKRRGEGDETQILLGLADEEIK